jgi:hypothetical protein
LVGDWWYENIVEPDKLPLLICLAAFVVTFITTRAITRMIRAGIGPFRNNVSASGVHIHHAVPGIILLIFGSLMSLRSPSSPWFEIAAVTVGIGMSLILDEFGLILHLEDVYWSDEGRISVEMAGLTAACLGLFMLGFSPLGVDDLTVGDISVRLTLLTGLVLHGVLVLVCVLKGKYRAALISLFVPFVAWVSAFRLGRPKSWWGKRRYRGKKLDRAVARAIRFDDRWDPKWRWLSDMIAGKPSEPDPDPMPALADRPAAMLAGPDSGPPADLLTPTRRAAGQLAVDPTGRPEATAS